MQQWASRTLQRGFRRNTMLSTLQRSLKRNRTLLLGLSSVAVLCLANYSGRAAVKLDRQHAYRLEMLELGYKTVGASKVLSAFDLPPAVDSAQLDLRAFRKMCTATSPLLAVDLVEFHKTIVDLLQGVEGAGFSNGIVFTLSTDGIASLCRELIAYADAVLDTVAGVAPQNVTWGNVMQPLVDLDAQLDGMAASIGFLAHVSDNAEIRSASLAAEVALQKAAVEAGMRMDVYSSCTAYAATEHAKGLQEGTEQHRYLGRVLRDYKRLGLDLAEVQRTRIKELQMQMSELSSEFQANLGEDDTALWFTAEEVKGLSEGVLSRLETDKDGKYKLTMAYPVILPAMKEIRSPETRRKLDAAFNSRCLTRNTEIIELLAKLRHEVAQLLGFNTHADYVLDTRMAKSPSTVIPFLSDLSEKLQPLMETERARLLHFKQLEEGEAFDGKLNPWDLRYYMNVVEKEDYKVDHAEIQKYFPLDVVTKGMLSMYETLLGLTFVLEEGAQTWHEDVLLYNVEDAKSGSHMGQFYLDLYPRPGKFGHAAVFPLVGRAVDAETNAVQTPVVAMVANFPKPTDSQPSLLPHNEVRTYFHELGHVMHGVCTQVSLRRFSGTNVERDFVEAPSQMLENWVFEPEALARMSGHVDDNSKPLPAELVDALVASKNANVALSSKRQLVFGLLDQTIHSTPDADTAQIYRDSLKEIMGMDAAPNTNMVASFGHLAGGYDSQYYGYMWSEVFSVDMFESRFKGHVLDPAVGADYRAAILAPGGSVDATKMLKNFLGRAPNSEAFLISKGLSK